MKDDHSFLYELLTKNIIMVRIGVVLPTFTAAAYNFVHPNYYDWYVEYNSENSEGVTYDLNELTAVVPTTQAQLTNPDIKYVPDAEKLYNHLLATRPTDTVSTLTDIDIHNGAQVNYDILVIFHEEYVTQQAYSNFQSFVTMQGGVLVAMDGNVFFAQVSYDPSAQTTTLISGHYWQQVTNPNGEKVAKAGTGEYWKSTTQQWFGSNSDAAPDISIYAYLATTLGYNPFGYPLPPTSGAENQYRCNSNDVVLVDYNASVSPSSEYLGPISTYYLDSENGRSLVFGIFTDMVQSNPVFLSFFDQIFEDYAVNRSTAPYTGNPGPSVHGIRLPPPKNDSKLKLENMIRKKMGLPEVSGR